MSAADSIRVTVHGRGGHGSMPQHTVDPVMLAALIIIRLQTVVSREAAPGDTAVETVGSCHAGTRSNVIPDFAVLDEVRVEIPARTIDEPRWLVIGQIDGKHWSVVVTYRRHRIRIISARRSRKEEVALYEG